MSKDITKLPHIWWIFLYLGKPIILHKTEPLQHKGDFSKLQY